MAEGTFVDQLAQASKDAKDILGEIRSELREVRRQRQALADDLVAAKAAVAEVVHQAIDAEVAKGLAEYGDTVKAAMDSAVAKVKVEIDGLFNTYMTGNKHGRAADGLDLRRPLPGLRGLVSPGEDTP
jgi:hypothetical protein